MPDTHKQPEEPGFSALFSSSARTVSRPIRLFAYLLAALPLVSCGVRSASVYQELPLTKQKQKIAFLQKKLQLAEREEKKLQSQIESLSDEVRQAQISYIRRRLDDYEEWLRKQPGKRKDIDTGELFLKERELLHQIIQSGTFTFEAQVVLDRILQLITELSDEFS